MAIEDISGTVVPVYNPIPIEDATVGWSRDPADGAEYITLTINGVCHYAELKHMAEIAVMIAEVVTERHEAKNKSQAI